MKFKRLYIDGEGAPLVAMQSPGDYELHLYDSEGIQSLLLVHTSHTELRSELLLADTMLLNYRNRNHV